MKIIGCGACMINGTPFSPEESFFHRAIARVRPQCAEPIEAEVVCFGGFPAPRVVKHFPGKVLAKKSAIVVVQFGSTDTATPLRKDQALSNGKAPFISAQESRWPAIIRWQAVGLLATLTRRPPVTPEAAYLQAINQLITLARASGTIPIIVSPFVFGSARSNRFARRYTAALRALIPAGSGAYLLDAFTELSRHDRRKVLCPDGFHLSRFGHELIAEKLAALITTLHPRREPETINAGP